MNLIYQTFNLFFLIILSIRLINCSTGDQLPYFSECLQYCLYFNCSTDFSLNEFNSRQSTILKFIGWGCKEECNYYCQWTTINYLINEKNISKLPQFYGKWTFIRYFGLQEPASAVFSLLNLITYLISWLSYTNHVISLTFLNQKCSFFKFKEFFKLCFNDKEFILNNLNALSALNAWFWSTIFIVKISQQRKKWTTFQLFLFVTTGFTVSLIKLLDEFIHFRKTYFQVSVLILILSFCIYHENYLLNGKIDYEYNMKVNLVLGISLTIFWMIWCSIRFRKFKTKYLFKCILGLILMNLFLTFEIFDFQPLFYIFDAHSLWHLGTIFLHPIYFSFLLDEFKFRSARGHLIDTYHNLK